MKQILKSLFISAFPLFSLYFCIKSIIHLWQYGLSFIYIGLLLISTTIAAFFILLFIKPVARTDANLKVYTSLIALGFLINLISGGYIDHNIINSLPSIMLIIGWILYLKWYSIFTNRASNKMLQVGDFLPLLTLQGTKGNIVLSSQFLGNPSIYLFYRGNWCPLCMAQIKEITTYYKILEEKNINMIFISPQSQNHTRSLADKFDLNFNFLIDKNNKVAKQLDIIAKNGLPFGFQVLGYDKDTVMPTVLITDKKGKIIFSDLTDNYRVRPEPETFIEIIDQHLSS